MGKNVKSYSSKGTATPDHVIRVKPFPLVITPKKNSTIEEFKLTTKKAFDDYRKKYVNYFNVNKKKVKGKKNNTRYISKSCFSTKCWDV